MVHVSIESEFRGWSVSNPPENRLLDNRTPYRREPSLIYPASGIDLQVIRRGNKEKEFKYFQLTWSIASLWLMFLGAKCTKFFV